jgi:hypothetical protein
MVKLYDLAVRIGSYTARDGAEKGKYLNVGALMQKDDGGKFILMNRTFNPAGVPNPDNKDSFIVSMFKPKGAETHDTPPPPMSDDYIPYA